MKKGLEKLLLATLAIVAWVGFVYVGFALTYLTIDFTLWSESARVAYLRFTSLGIIPIVIIRAFD